MTDLPALERRLAEATGPDREIDRDIGLLLGGWSYLPPEHEICVRFPEVRWLHNGDREIFADSDGALHEPCYSESLDAALALAERVLPGCVWQSAKFRRGDKVDYYADLFNVEALSPHAVDDHFNVRAPTPALAVCLAIVRAKLAQQGQEHE